MREESQLASVLLKRNEAGAIIPEKTVFFINQLRENRVIDEEYKGNIWDIIQNTPGLPTSLQEALVEMEFHLFPIEVGLCTALGEFSLYVGDGIDWCFCYDEAQSAVCRQLLSQSWLWPSPYDRRN
jgi:hypothetical protein